jgi:hypothetical protein
MVLKYLVIKVPLLLASWDVVGFLWWPCLEGCVTFVEFEYILSNES